MKITDIKTSLLQVPFKEVLRASYGARTHATYILLEIHTDEGLVGYGEHDGLFFQTADAFIHSELKPLLIGEDPLRIEYLAHKMDHFMLWNSFSAYPISAVDMALYDLKGKALGVPVYELLGGLYRDRMEVTGLIHLHSIDEDAEAAVRLVEEGHRILKIKVGFDLSQDLQRLAAIREAVGTDIPFRLDPNMAWSPQTAIRRIKAMEEYGLQWVEQPVPSWDLDGLLKVSNAVDTPLSADESCMSVRDALKLAETGAVEVFNVYLTESGGITRAREIAAIANTAGISCVIGTWGEGGVGQAAVLHTVAASRNFQLPGDSTYGLVSDDYIEKKLSFTDGCLEVPPGPGLGVTPDPHKVSRYSDLQAEDRVFAGLGPGQIPRTRAVL